MPTPADHARRINALPFSTRSLVLDALRVRAMSFVDDRLRSDGGDEAADVYRELRPEADDMQAFNPERYP